MEEQRLGLGATEPVHTQGTVAAFALAAVALHLFLRFGVHTAARIWGLPLDSLPLVLCLLLAGGPLVVGLLSKLARRELGADFLAGISIATSALLGEYFAGSLVVLMLSGGGALEAHAVRIASSVLEALARRMPSRAQRKWGGLLSDVSLDEIAVGDELVDFPHEICPADGTVLDGHGTMDESFLTGEPYLMPKTPGTTVISGAIDGDVALTIRAENPAGDSCYARIMRVMRASEQWRPQLRRLGDHLGAGYTPLAVAIALAA
jgi:cation transport ATPase